MPRPDWLRIHGARQNNLKNVSVAIPHDRVTVVTGVSGSGKSSLAFDTIFAEGQWRFIESLSSYARMFLERIDRPDVDLVEHIRPAIALEQKNPVRTARSTVGTATELTDYLRLLYAKIGRVHCPQLRAPGRRRRAGSASPRRWSPRRRGPGRSSGSRCPCPRPTGSGSCFGRLVARGFARIKVGDDVVPLSPLPDARTSPGARRSTWSSTVSCSRPDAQTRLAGSFEQALPRGRRPGGRGDPAGRPPARGPPLRRALRLPCLRDALERPQPLLFSFNHPLGACAECKGFGNLLRYDEARVVPDPGVSLAERRGRAVAPPLGRVVPEGAAPGRPAPQGRRPAPLRRSCRRPSRRWVYEGDEDFCGIRGFFEEVEGYRYKLHVRVFLSRYRSQVPCPACGGARLKPEALAVTVDGQHHRRRSPACPSTTWPAGSRRCRSRRGRRRSPGRCWTGSRRRSRSSVAWASATSRIERQTRTLSGGEAQRIALATQLGAQLVGTLYVLDEPSIGLHARDVTRLAELCRELAHAGNTVVVVEHDRTFIEAADHCVELGPGSGERGGEIVFAGPRDEFLRDMRTLTARYLSGRESIPLPGRAARGRRAVAHRRRARASTTSGASPRASRWARSRASPGVSGSGKSTLVHDTLYRAVARAFKTEFEAPGAHDALLGLEHLRGVRLIDQEPIGRTPRSNPVTYIKAFDDVRRLFASLPKAKALGLGPGHFSFNVPGGRCETCEGDGFEKLEMYFFEDVYVTCRECEGRRYRPDVRQVAYQGRDISQVLQMTVDEAVAFFSATSGADPPPAGPSGRGARLPPARPARHHPVGRRGPAPQDRGGAGRPPGIATSSTSSTSRRPGSTSTTSGASSACSSAWWMPATRSSSSSTTSTSSSARTGSWTSAPRAGEAGGELVAEGPPEAVAQVAASYTGKYLQDLLRDDRASERPASRRARN